MSSSAADKNWSVIVIATLAALALRAWFVTAAHIDIPNRGDAGEYIAYATNLVQHQVFSVASGNMSARPDNYRDPGYPLFLSFWVTFIHDPSLRYTSVQWAQALLSSLTVSAYLLLARRWLTLPWLIFCAALLAFWPHSITMPAYVLSETLLGFLVAAGLCLLAEGAAREQGRWLMCGAAAFGLAGLTNVVMAPFLPLLAAIAWFTHPSRRNAFALILLTSLTPPACWAIRNALIVQGSAASSRAIINLVQGSWPEYHDAWRASLQGNAAGKATSACIEEEVRAAIHSPSDGVISILKRIDKQPLRYIGWYASKPALLWDWNMRIAAAPLYVFPTQDSALESGDVLRMLVRALKALNPWIGVLAFTGCGIALWGLRTYDAAITALLLLHATLIYGLFQSEPRYAVPFRGAEIVMSILAMAWVTGTLANNVTFLMVSRKNLRRWYGSC
ncbi:4-amino-4-deoxy-L-arabinose transferase-like glycosyltransferase [Luteibacter sp. HA06]